MDKLRDALDEIIRDEVARQMKTALAGLHPALTRHPQVESPDAPQVPSGVERLIPISVVGEILGVGRAYVDARIKEGELPVVELGSTRPKRRVPESAVIAFIASRTFGGQ
jgi:hypothetical protein